MISGHDHSYQRFAPQTENGVRTADGIRQFVVATAGSKFYPMAHYRTGHNLQVWQNRHFGVLKLTLRGDSYSWVFKGLDTRWTDKGTTPTHNALSGGC